MNLQTGLIQWLLPTVYEIIINTRSDKLFSFFLYFLSVKIGQNLFAQVSRFICFYWTPYLCWALLPVTSQWKGSGKHFGQLFYQPAWLMITKVDNCARVKQIYRKQSWSKMGVSRRALYQWLKSLNHYREWQMNHWWCIKIVPSCNLCKKDFASMKIKTGNSLSDN